MPLVCVYRGSGPTEAYLVGHFLEGNGIDTHVRADLLGLRGEIPVDRAWPSVWVPAPDQARALDALQQFFGPRLIHPRWTCPGCGEVNEATFDWCWRCQTEPTSEVR